MIDKTRRTGAALEAHYQFLTWLAPPVEKLPKISVMAARVAAIHVFLAAPQRRKTWMAGTSPAIKTLIKLLSILSKNRVTLRRTLSGSSARV